ncbi:tyrosine-type recombinase/integrase [Isoptericola sp. b441]|uniref:Tyrosine-type recombinase/integrase n=1 Tax=Actinotalea lenta TaxID=3064654 RepID=A0ABT9D8F2_9CELL|nr:tyrosine-type recombinase/integrase [Isoptericola sp. b441]MDO8107162.1 tyrosine-type recombinase/integrase [Isoptericola sp. b441]
MNGDGGWELEAWETALRAAGRSEQTIGLRLYHVRRLARWAAPAGPWGLRLDDLLAWSGAQRWQAETRRSYRASLRAYWRWGVATGRTLVDVAAQLPEVPPAKPDPRPAPPEAVQAAIADADDRVWLMIRLAHDLGLRRGEVAQVHSDDLSRDLLGWTLHVHGKGSRNRDVPLPDSLARVLRALPPGFAFPGADHGHLSARWVGRLVGRLLPAGVTMHQLRHACATELHDATHDLRAIQELLGHASVATTQRYVKVRPDTIRAMVNARTGCRVA